MKKVLSHAISKENFLINYFRKKHNLQSTDGKTQFVNDLVPFINLTNPIEYDVFLELIAKECSLSINTIKKTLSIKNKTIKKDLAEDDIDVIPNVKTQKLSRIKRVQRQLLYYVLENSEAYE